MGSKEIAYVLLVLLSSCSARKWNIFNRQAEVVTVDKFVVPKRLTAGFESNFAISIDPKDNLAFYTSNRGNNIDIWAKKLTGGTAQRVTYHAADDFTPSVSPNGDYLAFISRRQDATGDLHIIDLGLQFKNYIADSEKQSEVVKLPLTVEQNPVWFPDSEKILFESIEASSGDLPRLMVVDVEDRIPAPYFNLRGNNPQISSDGKWITYMKNNGIYIFSIEHEKETQITNGSLYYDGQPYFKEDLTGVYFMRFAHDTNKDSLLNGDDSPTIWHIELEIGKNIKKSYAYPITSLSAPSYYPIHFDKSIYFTMLNSKTLDVFSLPESGHLDPSNILIDRLPKNNSDKMYALRRKAVERMNAKKADESLPFFVAEFRLLGKNGRFSEALKLKKFVEQNVKGLKGHQKSLLDMLTMEAKYGSNLFPLSSVSFNQISSNDLKKLKKQKSSYSKSIQLLVATETLLARIEASNQSTDRALNHVDFILDQTLKNDQLTEETTILKVELLTAAMDYKTALETITAFESKYPKRNSASVIMSNHVIQGIVKKEKEKKLVKLLADIRIDKSYSESIISRAHIEQAIQLMKKDKIDLAANEFRVIVDEYKNSDATLIAIYDILANQSNEMDPITRDLIHRSLYDRIDHSPQLKNKSKQKYLEYLVGRARYFQSIGEPALAIKEFQKILTIDPINLTAHRGVILGYFQKNLLDRKIEFYRNKSKDEDPIWNYLYQYASTFSIDTNEDISDKLAIIDETTEEIENTVESDPTIAEFHLTLGWLYFQKKTWDQKYLSSKSIGSKMTQSWRITKGFFGFDEKDWLKSSIDSYLTALYLSKDDPINQSNIKQNLAEAYHELGNHPEALKYYLHRIKALDRFPIANKEIEANLYFKAASSAYHSDKHALAVALQKRGIIKSEKLKNKSTQSKGYDRLAFYQDLANRHRESLKTYQKILLLPHNKTDPFNRMVTLGNIARTQYNAGSHEDSLETLERYLKILKELPEDHAGFQNQENSAIEISLGNKEASSGRLSKGMRLLYAFTLQNLANQKLGRFVEALDAQKKKVDQLKVMREGKFSLFSKNAYLSEHLSIAFNNLAVLESKMGKYDDSSEHFRQSAAFANIFDPGKEKLSKPPQINYHNSLSTALATVGSTKDSPDQKVITNITEDIKPHLEKKRIDERQGRMKEAISALSNEGKEFQISKKDRKTFKTTLKKKINKDRLALYSHQNLYQELLKEYAKKNLSKQKLSFADRKTILHSAALSCRQAMFDCGDNILKAQSILTSAFHGTQYKKISLPSNEEIGHLIAISYGNEVFWQLFSKKQNKGAIKSSKESFWQELNKRSNGLVRLYLIPNGSNRNIYSQQHKSTVPLGIISRGSDVDKIEKKSRLTATSLASLDSRKCTAFVKSGLLCSTSKDYTELAGKEPANYLILDGTQHIHKLTDKFRVKSQTPYAHHEITKIHSDMTRTLILNTDMKLSVRLWKDYHFSDFINRLAADVSNKELQSLVVNFGKPGDDKLIRWIENDLAKPQSLNTIEGISSLVVGHPGRTLEQKQLIAEELSEKLEEQYDTLLDQKKTEQASRIKRQILYLAKILEDEDWQLDTLEDLVQMDFSSRRFHSALFFQKERLKLISKEDEEFNEIVLNAGILAVRDQANDDAEKYLGIAKVQYEKDLSQLAKIHFYYALHYKNIRAYKKAIESYLKARNLYSEAGDKLKASEQLLSVATTYKEGTNEFAKAIRYYKLAIEEFEEQDEFESRFRSQLDLANTFISMGRTTKAIELLESLAEDAEDTNSDDRLSYSQFLANAYYRSGQYQKSSSELKNIFASAASLESVEKRTLIELNASNLLAMVTAKLSSLEDGLDILIKGVETSQSFGFDRHTATRFNNIGYLQREQGAYAESVVHFQKALSIDRKLRSKENIAFDLRNLGLSYLLMNRFDLAEKQLTESLELSRGLGLSYNTTYCLFGLGDLSWAKSDFTKSFEFYEQALKIAKASFLQDFIWKAHAGKARALVRLKQREKAKIEFENAVSIIESLRAGLTSTSAKTGFQSDAGVQSVFEQFVDLLMAQKSYEQAWLISEKARARAFIDSMGVNKVGIENESARKLVTLRETLQDQIEVAQITYSEEEDSETRSRIQEEIDSLIAQLDETTQKLKTEAPEISQFSTVSAFPLKDIQNRLKQRQVIIEYFVTDDYLHIWTISNAALLGATVKIQKKRLEKLAGEFHTLLKNYASMRFNLAELSKILIEPISAQISSAEQLIVIPHNFLHHLPFAPIDYKEKSLLDSFEISFLESASLLRFIELNSILKKENIVVFGNPNRGEQLDLPFAAKEAKAIKRYFPNAAVFTGNEASETQFFKSSQAASILHLASHGVFDKINPMDSKLLLTPDKSNNGNLLVSDLFSIKLNSSLVTLSACETGLGKVTTGDEVIGLNRAFFFAGTDSLISALWRISDVASAITMKRFYRYLAEGDSRATALRRAQLLVRDYFNHPAYWAPFKLTGAL